MSIFHKTLLAGSLIFCCFTTFARAEVLYTEDFERGTAGDWTSRGGEQVAVTTEAAHGGTYSLKVTGRTSFWNGAALVCTEVMAGQTYTAQASAMSKTACTFELCYQYEIDGTVTYVTISSQAATAGGWVTMSGSMTLPSSATDVRLYVQTAQGGELVDFYIDDISYSGEALPETQSLQTLFADYFDMGVCVSAQEISKSKAQEFVLFHYTRITPENELKPDALLNQSQSISNGNNVNPQVSLSSSARTVLQFCVDNNIPVRGHCLVWHSQTPSWFFKEGFKADGNVVSSGIMTQRMENYIKNVMSLIKSEFPTLKVYAWDVVNEAFQDGKGSLREAGDNNSEQGKSMWTKIYGDNSFIFKAFEYARKYAPEGCKLYYNDFNEYIEDKRDAIYDIVKQMFEQGICDGVGMQSHLDVGYPSAWLYEQAVAKYASIGCDVQVTELDITVSNNDEVTQANIYKEIFDVYKKHKESISLVTFWGTQDGMSWRGDRTPLIFNSQYQPKAAYYSIIDGMVGSGNALEQVQSTGEKIYGVRNAIVVENQKDTLVDVFALSGAKVATLKCNAGRTVLPMAKGIYIVNRTKVVVY